MDLARSLITSLLLATASIPAPAASVTPRSAPMETVKHLQDFQVIEFRRYTVAPGEREHFTRYFDTYFPEAFEQLGAMVFGQFHERGDANHFTWLRGFKDINARPIVNSAFYYGPLWKEHRVKVNAILPDSDNVMLLRPARVDSGVTVLPAVDPVTEPDGAQGIVVAQIFPVARGQEDAFAARVTSMYGDLTGPGVRPAGVLVSLDVPNNFPQLPIRTDGPWVVWLAVVRDEQALRGLEATMDQAEKSSGSNAALRGTPERIVMDPTPRSRLRWLDAP
jgi:hypothetical protein